MPAPKIVPVNDYLKPVKIMIVDPSPLMRSIVSSIYRYFGAERIRETDNADAALEAVMWFYPDLIVTEYFMEPTNGVELIRVLRDRKKCPNPFIPIIMVSAYTEAKCVAAARDAGVNEYVSKPLSANSLMVHTNEVIEYPRPFIQLRSYFGPDRRRTQQTYEGQERRKKAPQTGDVAPPLD